MLPPVNCSLERLDLRRRRPRLSKPLYHRVLQHRAIAMPTHLSRSVLVAPIVHASSVPPAPPPAPGCLVQNWTGNSKTNELRYDAVRRGDVGTGWGSGGRFRGGRGPCEVVDANPSPLPGELGEASD